MKTGNTAHFQRALSFVQNASMEPGHEDREYTDPEYAAYSIGKPQWSPAMKTGNTGDAVSGVALGGHASMEPGHEDREYVRPWAHPAHMAGASMEPGHEDREYPAVTSPPSTCTRSLNGARP